MTAFREEMFGPVAAITIAKEQNMRWNWLMIVSSAFQRPFYHRRNTGQTDGGTSGMRWGVINGYCASDARVAFGGVKKSGLVVSFPISAYTNSVISRRCERPDLTLHIQL